MVVKIQGSPFIRHHSIPADRVHHHAKAPENGWICKLDGRNKDFLKENLPLQITPISILDSRTNRNTGIGVDPSPAGHFHPWLQARQDAGTCGSARHSCLATLTSSRSSLWLVPQLPFTISKKPHHPTIWGRRQRVPSPHSLPPAVCVLEKDL